MREGGEGNGRRKGGREGGKEGGAISRSTCQANETTKRYRMTVGLRMGLGLGSLFTDLNQDIKKKKVRRRRRRRRRRRKKRLG